MATTRPLILSIFPGVDLLGRAFEEEWPDACVVRGPDLIFGGDIRAFHPPGGKFSGIIGGVPCQFFSTLAHLVRANGHEPRHGNMFPEYERVVKEAEPLWFFCECVPGAPGPAVEGYTVHSFLWGNHWLGEPQIRTRRFWFGIRGDTAVDLRRWLPQAPLELPTLVDTCTQNVINNSDEAKGRAQSSTLIGGGGPALGQRLAVLGDSRERPVKIGGSGKVKRPAVDGRGPGHRGPVKSPCVTAAHQDGGGSVRMRRYRLPEACRLQGLPEDFLEEAPFTAQGKLQAVANGVPIQLGRVMAVAVKTALAQIQASDSGS